MRKLALNHGNWKPNEELRVRYEEQVKANEYEDQEETTEQIIPKSLIENDDNNNYKTGSKKSSSLAQQAILRRANMNLKEQVVSVDYSTAVSSNSQENSDSLQPQLIAEEHPEKEDYVESGSIFTRNITLEDGRHSHGCIYNRKYSWPVSPNGKVYFSTHKHISPQY